MAEPDRAAPPPADLATEAPADCVRCGKPPELCVCEGIAPLETRVSLLILQHPQEQDRALGTARLTALHFAKAQLKIGLSWPSLSKLLGHPADPQRWAVLYLGSLKAAALAPDREIVVLDKTGTAAAADQNSALRDIEGVILLDGTWSQAKALWWRNAWMLKCRRVVLDPHRPSRYGRLRREPRSDGLSTLEAAAMLMARLDGRPEIETVLTESFESLLARYRETHGNAPGRATPKRDWRRRRGRPPRK
jgi:DTW domain-containing protein YfiP